MKMNFIKTSELKEKDLAEHVIENLGCTPLLSVVTFDKDTSINWLSSSTGTLDDLGLYEAGIIAKGTYLSEMTMYIGDSQVLVKHTNGQPLFAVLEEGQAFNTNYIVVDEEHQAMIEQIVTANQKVLETFLDQVEESLKDFNIVTRVEVIKDSVLVHFLCKSDEDSPEVTGYIMAKPTSDKTDLTDILCTAHNLSINLLDIPYGANQDLGFVRTQLENLWNFCMASYMYEFGSTGGEEGGQDPKEVSGVGSMIMEGNSDEHI